MMPQFAGPEQEKATVLKCCGLLDQMNAILYGVEQLLSDYNRHHVRRVLSIQSSSPPAVIGFCSELEDGTRLGQCPEGLGDASLESAGGKWEVFAPGEQILEAKGFGVFKGAAAGAAKGVASTPKAEPTPKARGKFSLQGAAQKSRAEQKS